jgi:hypothetical protein
LRDEKKAHRKNVIIEDVKKMNEARQNENWK